MRIPNAKILTTHWSLCAIGVIIATAMNVRVARHPNAAGPETELWIAVVMPYFLFGLSSWFLRYHFSSLMVVTATTGLFVASLSWAQFMDTNTILLMLEARAQGRHMMNCGPPATFLILPFAYLSAAVAVAGGFTADLVRVLPPDPFKNLRK